MRFALLGDHPDGLDMARALVLSGRHELLVYSGPAVGAEYLRRWDLHVALVPDVEEVLADPAIDAVIVAGSPSVRAAQLRRALQSERHVLCVHPADQSPDAGYEAAMLRADTGHLLFPLLPDTLHPALLRMIDLANLRMGGFEDLRNEDSASAIASSNPQIFKSSNPQFRNSFRLIELERWSTESVLLDAGIDGHNPGLPGWEVLRCLGGEISEVSAFSVPEEVSLDEPIVVTGRFERGGLFQTVLVPQQSEARWRLVVLTREDRIELTMAHGWPGPAMLRWRDATGELREETWDAWNPWPAIVEAFEVALEMQMEVGRKQLTAGGRQSSHLIRSFASANAITQEGTASCLLPSAAGPTWHDAVRCLELDDAARRSIERRRSSTMEYQEATEEAGFKGTMTLVGCGLLWSSLFLLILSVWIPWLGWAILPVFALFLGLQLFRWIVPTESSSQQLPQPTAAKEEVRV